MLKKVRLLNKITFECFILLKSFKFYSVEVRKRQLFVEAQSLDIENQTLRRDGQIF